MKNSALHVTAFVLVVVGALNWGLVGLFNFDLVEAVLGGIPWLMRLIYVVVGLAGVALLATHKQDCQVCSAGVSPRPTSTHPAPPTS